MKQEVGFGVVEIGLEVAFTPKGGCPLKPPRGLLSPSAAERAFVAFTPKGGCPLKRVNQPDGLAAGIV